MFKHRSYSALVLAAAFIASACRTPAAAPTAAPTQDVGATQTVVAIANANNVATSVAATLTAKPSNTPLPTNTPLPSNTPQPTNTSTPADTATTPPTATQAPTSAPTATRTKAAVAATKAPVTQPSATKPAESGGSGGPLYTTASGGPQGYTSTLGCTQAGGAACQTTMAPGDVAFSIDLQSTNDALLAIFVPFGLSVEKDGVNQADMYMTVDAGWLQPGGEARMGTSRKFSAPGHYVIRTNGCLITEATYPACTWWTVNGTMVNFDIQ